MAHVPDRVPTRHDTGPLALVSRLEWGSSPNGPLSIASKSGSAEVRDSSRSIESATGGSTDKAGVTVATIVVHEDVDTDEFELDSDLSTEHLSLRKVAKSFAIDTSDQDLPKTSRPSTSGIFAELGQATQ